VVATTPPETAERRPLHTDGAPDANSPGHRIADQGDIASYLHGYADGIEAGRIIEGGERDALWRANATQMATGQPFAELERRRWGPGGRAHFGDPRPDDYPGRGGEAE
jgi:hypothetical protein